MSGSGRQGGRRGRWLGAPSRGWRIGAGLAVAYVAVVAATGLWTGQVRPLYDGTSLNSPYQWMAPPWYILGNRTPRPSTATISMAGGTSALAGVSSSDGQLVLHLPPGALPPVPGATGVTATITPVDPRKLAAPPKLPAQQVSKGESEPRADGNAYRVTFTYQPSGAPLTQLADPGNVVIVTPDEAERILYSPTGKSWLPQPTQTLGDTLTVGTQLTRPGYFLVDTLIPFYRNPNAGRHFRQLVGWALVGVTLALFLALGSGSLRRRARRTGGSRAGSRAGPPRTSARAGPGPTRTVRRRRR